MDLAFSQSRIQGEAPNVIFLVDADVIVFVHGVGMFATCYLNLVSLLSYYLLDA